MSNYTKILSLSYLHKDKIKEFSSIKNASFHYRIGHLLYKRINIKDYFTIEDLENKYKYHLYDETINIQYLKTGKGLMFLSRLSEIKRKKEEIIVVNENEDVELLSFCQFDHIKEFHFTYSITDRAIECLIKSDFKQLQILNLFHSQITDKAIEYLIKCDFKLLQKLFLYSTHITDKAIEYLIKCDFKQLKALWLSETFITDKAIEYLIKCNFRQLENLSLYSTQITDKAIEYLIECDFKQLKVLSLYKTEITEKSIDYLIKCDYQKILIINLWNTQIIDTSRLESKYPNCEI